MTVLFLDGFSHYTANADIDKKWSERNAAVISAGNGRFGTASLRNTTGGSITTKALAFGDSTSIAGFAFRCSSVSSSGVIAEFACTSGPIELFVNTTGTLAVRRNGTVLATSTLTISSNVYYHLGFKVLHHASTGTVQVQVNGADYIPSTGSLNTGTGPATSFSFRQVNGTTDRSDLYLADGTGSAPWNDLLGDCKVETLAPSGAGTTTQWTPSAGSNFQNVDEAAPDGDTTYNSETTATELDLYAMGDLGTSGGTVRAVQVVHSSRKDDASLRQVAPMLRVGGVNYTGTTQTLATDYTFYLQVHQRDPSPADWTISSVNASEAGIKLIA